MISMSDEKNAASVEAARTVYLYIISIIDNIHDKFIGD